jgi:cytochrome bd-type quinol oxidase subunit 2
MDDIWQQITWRPTIGDPSVMGWVTVAAYALAAGAALAASTRAERAGDAASRSSLAWLLVAGLMALLCVNKQLDLQSLLTDLGRVLARRQGWYEDRHHMQKLFIFALISGALVAATALGMAFHRFWRQHALLGVGLVVLLTFIAVRAIGFHHLDILLHTAWAGVKFNWAMELSGIALVTWAALRAHRLPQ